MFKAAEFECPKVGFDMPILKMDGMGTTEISCMSIEQLAELLNEQLRIYRDGLGFYMPNIEAIVAALTEHQIDGKRLLQLKETLDYTRHAILKFGDASWFIDFLNLFAIKPAIESQPIIINETVRLDADTSADVYEDDVES